MVVVAVVEAEVEPEVAAHTRAYHRAAEPEDYRYHHHFCRCRPLYARRRGNDAQLLQVSPNPTGFFTSPLIDQSL